MAAHRTIPPPPLTAGPKFQDLALTYSRVCIPIKLSLCEAPFGVTVVTGALKGADNHSWHLSQWNAATEFTLMVLCSLSFQVSPVS